MHHHPNIARHRIVLLLAVLTLSSTAARREARAEHQPLCGTRSAPPATWDHVVWIWFENHGYDAVVGSSAAPRINRTLIPSCGLATNYHSLAHPSLPNYIAATSGLPVSALGPMRDDCNATGACHTGAPSIFLEASSWGAYEESMRRPCTHKFTGLYAASHDPAVYYTNLPDCRAHDLNLRALGPALHGDTLPAFVFIMPNMCNSMHNCSVQTGDSWLWRIVERLTASRAYQAGTMAVFVTFDESAKDDSDDRVATIVISPSTAPHTRSGKRFSHYSLLRTTEEMLGISRLLGEARHAPSMRSAFNL
jgi:phosphatidylinositol-3-phosphatase